LAPVAEEGFHDLVFAIQKNDHLLDGSRQLTAAGIAKGQPVEFAVQLPVGGRKDRVLLRSLGAGSDRLIRELDGLYKTKLAPKQMAAATEFAAIPLEGNPSMLDGGPVKIKLFFESEDEARYAELYLNIDLGSGRLYLREKDPDYRAAVVRALSAVAVQ
jgi:hypothetical protein